MAMKKMAATGIMVAMLACSELFGAPEPAISDIGSETTREVITRENARLKESIQELKQAAQSPALEPHEVSKIQQAIARMETTLSLHDLILKRYRIDTCLIAITIVHADLERHYASLEEAGDANSMKAKQREQNLLGELETLEDYRAWMEK
jgi:ribosomal protein L29